MKIGDYVRTDTGDIGKITKIIGEEKNIKDCYLNFKDMVIYGTENDVIGIQGKVIKSSPNIIDLIEVGDYVNGYRVENIMIKLGIPILCIETGSNYFQSPFIHEEDIKSIVTSQQFESMEYKVGE